MIFWSEMLNLHLVSCRPCPPWKYLPPKSSATEQTPPLKEPSSRHRSRALAFHVTREAPPWPHPGWGPAALSGFNISCFFYSLGHNHLPFHPFFFLIFCFYFLPVYFSRSHVFNSSNNACMRREGNDEGREKERFRRVSCLRGTPFPGLAHRAPQTCGEIS